MSGIPRPDAAAGLRRTTTLRAEPSIPEPAPLNAVPQQRLWLKRSTMFGLISAVILSVATPGVVLSSAPESAKCGRFQAFLIDYVLLMALRFWMLAFVNAMLWGTWDDSLPGPLQSPRVQRLLRMRATIRYCNTGLFILGNFAVFQSMEYEPACSSVPLHRYAMTLLIMQYIQFVLPIAVLVTLLLAVLLCRPLVIRLLLAISGVQLPSVPRPAEPAEISSLPETTFNGAVEGGDTMCLV